MIETNDNVDTQLPKVSEIKNTMKILCKILYQKWKFELTRRLKNLEFKGDLSIKNEHHLFSRLPNKYIRTALSKLQDDLDVLGYDYSFKFEDVFEHENWSLRYEIELPEDITSSDENDEEYEDDILVTVSSDSDELEYDKIKKLLDDF